MDIAFGQLMEKLEDCRVEVLWNNADGAMLNHFYQLAESIVEQAFEQDVLDNLRSYSKP